MLLFSSSLCSAGSEPSHSVVDREPYKNRHLLFCSVFVKPSVAVGRERLNLHNHDATHTHTHQDADVRHLYKRQLSFLFVFLIFLYIFVKCPWKSLYVYVREHWCVCLNGRGAHTHMQTFLY